VNALRAAYDLILPDARGHGLSDPGAGDYSAKARAADLIGLIEALGLEKPVIGGHSMGGDTSLHAAALRPDLIAGFFMEDPPFTLPGEPLFGGPAGQGNQLGLKQLRNALKLIKKAPKFISQPLGRRLMPGGTPEVIEAWLASKQRVSEDFIQTLEDPQWLAGGLDDDLGGKITVPGLLIYGDRDKGAIVSEDAADRIAAQIQGLRVVHLPGATHDIRRTQFEGYLGAVRMFLQELR
jgi:pimeloyl-ACP methyl ester carboxylesterase